MLGWAGEAAAQQVRITKLTDVTAAITNFAADTVAPQNICVFSSAATKRYSIRASGSGDTNAFTLANGARTMAYQVQWSGQSGQTTGTALTANVKSATFTSTATNQTCASGPATTASLILIVRSAAASGATAGAYAGTLTLLVAPE